MADSAPTPAETVVRGEMQPWTDYAGPRRPAGGPVLHRLLDDLLPPAAPRTLVVGPHDSDLIALVAGRSGQVTVLVRSVSDAATLRDTLGAGNVTVVAGALDGLDAPQGYDVVLAVDGLDRVLGADSAALTWPERAAALAGTAAGAALVIIGVENEFSLTAVLDRRPVDARHGDDEWRPLHDDPTRPTSPEQVLQALHDLGPRTLYAVFDDAGRPHTVLDSTAASRTRPGRPAARLAEAGLAAAAAHTPLLGPVADGTAAAARAGALGAVASGWLAVCGPGPDARTGYTAAGNPGDVLVLDQDGESWQVDVRTGDGEPPSGATGVVFDPALVARQVPDTESAEVLLQRLAAAEDVPGFRALAGRLGDWARSQESAALPLFDDVQVEGEGFAGGILGWRTVDAVSASESLAAAWQRFADRLLRGHRRHPWPPWMTQSGDMVSMWLAMSGVQVTDALLKRGREIADAVAAAEPAVAAEPDLRTALADAEAARVASVEAAGRIFGLERTLRFRDQQLRSRDQQLRTREQQLRSVRDELRRLKGSRSMQVAQLIRKAAVVRQPKRLARAVKRRLRSAAGNG